MMGLLLDQNLDPNIKFQLTDILLHSDLSLFEPYQEVLLKSEAFNNRLQARFAIASLDNDALFKAFEHFIQDAYGKYMNQIDSYYGNALVRRLLLRSVRSTFSTRISIGHSPQPQPELPAPLACKYGTVCRWSPQT